VPGAPRNITSVLTTVRYDQAHLDRLREIFAGSEFVHVSPDDTAGIAEALKTVDVAVLAADLDERYLDAPHLTWVHCDHSGLNGSAKPAILASDLLVTGSAGRAAPALAQHAFFFALALTYDAPGLISAQRQHGWRVLPGYEDRRGLWGKTIGIIGLGSTGLATAELAKAFGMRVLAYRKGVGEPPASVDRLYCADRGDGLTELLAESDVVVLSIRLTDATYRLIGAAELAAMKPTAYLINMARGPVVDEAALVAALHAGTIAGAGLDVFEQEPLPADAAIWDAPNVVMTPHVTAEMPDLAGRSLELIAENARRYRAGEPLLNQLTPDDVYSH
jgi:phosphoglycerate dehydrogenase-like enzyme